MDSTVGPAGRVALAAVVRGRAVRARIRGGKRCHAGADGLGEPGAEGEDRMIHNDHSMINGEFFL